MVRFKPTARTFSRPDWETIMATVASGHLPGWIAGALAAQPTVDPATFWIHDADDLAAIDQAARLIGQLALI